MFYTFNQEELKLALSNNNIYSIKFILETTPNIIHKCRDDVIHTPILDGNVKIVKLPLNAGANANSVDTNGKPAIEMAISFGNVEIVELLLNAGAIYNNEQQLLFPEDIEKAKQVSKLLIDYGYDINTDNIFLSPNMVNQATLENELRNYVLNIKIPLKQLYAEKLSSVESNFLESSSFNPEIANNFIAEIKDGIMQKLENDRPLLPAEINILKNSKIKSSDKLFKHIYTEECENFMYTIIVPRTFY